MALAES